MIRKLCTFLLTIGTLVSVVNIFSQAESLSPLTRHVRGGTLNGQAKCIGRLPAIQSLRLDIVLSVRDQAGMDNLFQKLYDPSSPSYMHFLTVEEFTSKFGPTQEQYDAVVHFATANGFAVVGGSRDAMDVQVKGSVATIENAFHLTMGLYQHPTENRAFYAPDREPSVDLPFQLWHISGLDNYFIPRTALSRRTTPVTEATTGSCPQASFCGSDMRAAYYGGTALTGANQNIGLLEFLGFDIDDVNTYYSNIGQTRTAAVTGISTDNTPLTCYFNMRCDDTEQTLDITQALGMAPGTTTVYMYVGSSHTAILGAMSSSSPLPAQLSSSWFWMPSDPTTDDPYFERMALQGQSYFQAAGDEGNFHHGYPTWPCDSAYVISVGGTVLVTQSAGGPWQSESTWADGGGGFWAADDIPIPSWQKATAKGCAQCSQTYRNAPDVSANSDWSFYVCADQTTCTANEDGGTSFAAPMFAGYMALINQKRVAAGQSTAGFINPSLYRVGLSKGYGSYLHDIVTGNNGNPATIGFDLATGWGSPKAGSPVVGGKE